VAEAAKHPSSDPVDATGLAVVDAPHHQRYELRRGTELVSFANYLLDGEVLVIPHVETVPVHRGHGFSEVLLDEVVALAQRAGRRIRPTCGHAAAVLRSRPDAAAILEARRA
jgi:predicted GNAT family acetyltransferase